MRALITGISGQDGSLLSEFLISKGYDVYGIMRPESDQSNLEDLIREKKVKIISGDLMNEDLLRYILTNIQIDEIYNLASQSNIRLSYEKARLTFEVTLMGTISLIESVKNYSPKTRVFQAGSSSMFGKNCDDDGLQRETTPFNPVSPYASSKLFAYNICQNYRINQGIYISNGILYNHESVKNKKNLGIIKTIARKAVSIRNGNIETLDIPDPSIRIDFSHAKDCVEAMWISLQQKEADDYIIGSGESYSIEQICFYIFNKLGLNPSDYINKGGEKSTAFSAIGDPTKIQKLGWSRKYKFHEMLDEILNHELEENKPLR